MEMTMTTTTTMNWNEEQRVKAMYIKYYGYISILQTSFVSVHEIVLLIKPYYSESSTNHLIEKDMGGMEAFISYSVQENNNVLLPTYDEKADFQDFYFLRIVHIGLLLRVLWWFSTGRFPIFFRVTSLLLRRLYISPMPVNVSSGRFY